MAEDNFFDRVYEVVRLIPAGRVTSYGAIAAYLGSKSSSRVVGYAMKASISPNGLPVPAHRVVNRTGLLTGKFHFGSERMEQMLRSEGIEVENNQVQNFEKVFWDPAIELA